MACEAWRAARADDAFWTEVDVLLADYVGRPSCLYHARRLSADVGATVYLKREDLNHTGAHKINNCIGQAVLALEIQLDLPDLGARPDADQGVVLRRDRARETGDRDRPTE